MSGDPGLPLRGGTDYARGDKPTCSDSASRGLRYYSVAVRKVPRMRNASFLRQTLDFRLWTLDFSMLPMIGTALNVAGILIGGVGWPGAAQSRFTPANESFFKVALGVFTVFYGLRLTWMSLNGSFLQILKQLLIAVLALMLGKMAGRLLRLQKMSNRLGQQARERIAAIKPGATRAG